MENSYFPSSERRTVIGRRFETKSSLPLSGGDGAVASVDIFIIDGLGVACLFCQSICATFSTYSCDGPTQFSDEINGSDIIVTSPRGQLSIRR
jgi:hypothetical protein